MIINILKKNFLKIKYFGIQFAFINLIDNHIHCLNENHTFVRIKEKIIKDFLKREYADIINLFSTIDNKTKNEINIKSYTIWVCWLQGEENMPEIIKKCYQSMLKYSNENRVILITMENYINYVTIPDYIIDKVKKKIISLTHFSDILRICLLYEHGGLWLDATVFLTSPLEEIPFEVFSLKCKDDLWENINKKRWLIFVLYTAPKNILPEFVRRIFFEYLKKYNLYIDYYFLDHIINIGYETIPSIAKLIDTIPSSDAIPHFFHNNLNEKFDPIIYNQICSVTHFHKLNWKADCREYTNDGELTYYGYFLQTKNQ